MQFLNDVRERVVLPLDDDHSLTLHCDLRNYGEITSSKKRSDAGVTPLLSLPPPQADKAKIEIEKKRNYFRKIYPLTSPD